MKMHEWCPVCSHENELEHEYKVHHCKECGSRLLPCSICTEESCLNCIF